MEYATEWAVRDQWDDLTYGREGKRPRYAIMSKNVESVWMDRYYCADLQAAHELVETLNKPSIPFEPLEKVAKAKLEEILPIVDDLVFLIHNTANHELASSCSSGNIRELADQLFNYI